MSGASGPEVLAAPVEELGLELAGAGELSTGLGEPPPQAATVSPAATAVAAIAQ
ncbi:MAG: hypothetical protein ACRDNF_13250 [Streptosporangiaceae bacterium]